MKYVEEIEVLLTQFKTINIQLSNYSQKYYALEKSAYKITTTYLILLGIVIFFCSRYFLNWDWYKVIISILFVSPIVIPIEWLLKLLFKNYRKSSLGAIENLKNEITSLKKEDKAVQANLNKYLLAHIQRIKKLITVRYRQNPSKLVTHYIHSQFLQLTEIMNTMEDTYSIYWKKNYPTLYYEVKSEFGLLKVYFKTTFYPNSKSHNIT